MRLTQRSGILKYVIIAIGLVLATSGTTNAAPTKVVVNSYTQCSKLDPELSSACLANTGSKEPFTYFEISTESDCYAFSDTAIIDQCIEKIKKHELFQIPTTGTDTKIAHREVIKTPIEQIASSTKTLVILTAINLGITVAGIAAAVFIYLSSN